MDKKTVLDVVGKFKKAMESQGIQVKKLILFGSYTTGTYKEGSDIDLIVVSKDFEGKDYWKRIDILSQAIYEVFEPIEALAMTPDEWEKGDSFIAEYSKNGEVVYAA